MQCVKFNAMKSEIVYKAFIEYHKDIYWHSLDFDFMQKIISVCKKQPVLDKP